MVTERYLIIEDGKRIWKSVSDYDYDGENDFLEIGNTFETSGGVTVKPIGHAICKLFDYKSAVDFGAEWILKKYYDK